MTALRQAIDGFFRWIDCVAATIVAMAGWSASRRSVQLVEDERGMFVFKGSSKTPAPERIALTDGPPSVSEKGAALLRGSRAELVLRPDRFLFRPLELPK